MLIVWLNKYFVPHLPCLRISKIENVSHLGSITYQWMTEHANWHTVKIFLSGRGKPLPFLCELIHFAKSSKQLKNFVCPLGHNCFYRKAFKSINLPLTILKMYPLKLMLTAALVGLVISDHKIHMSHNESEPEWVVRHSYLPQNTTSSIKEGIIPLTRHIRKQNNFKAEKNSPKNTRKWSNHHCPPNSPTTVFIRKNTLHPKSKRMTRKPTI